MTKEHQDSDSHYGEDSAEYLARKKLFEHMITIYGRNPVSEALRDPQLQIYKLQITF